MKIKLAIVDNDQSYLSRIAGALEGRYANKFEIYCFTSIDTAINSVGSSGINVLLASTVFDVDLTSIPHNCGFAYLTESQDIDSYCGKGVVCKYQKVDLFYNSILAVYSEVNASSFVSSSSVSDQDTPLFVFTSASGGVGTSTAAAAYAISFALHGKRPLYLNLENFGDSNIFHTAFLRFELYTPVYYYAHLRAKN